MKVLQANKLIKTTSVAISACMKNYYFFSVAAPIFRKKTYKV